MDEEHPNPHDETTKTLMRYYFYISHDKSHDNYFVQHCLLLDCDNIVASGFRPS
jgi:hypothetical protein